MVLAAVLLCIFLGSTGMLVRELLDYREGDETYAEAEELVDLPQLPEEDSVPQPEAPAAGSAAASEPGGESPVLPVREDPYAEQLKNMDFTALRQVNSEVLGWILIPGTRVSYPVLQHSDNQYYLKHTWKKTVSSVGSIFMECQNDSGLSNFNTVIYGHNMNNGSMFGTLKKYKKQSYWAAHPTVYLTTDSGSHAYQVFAAYEVSTVGTTYQLGFSGENSRQSFLDFAMESSVIDTGIVPTTQDSILTLSTCTGHGHATRWVVQAVMKNPTAKPTEDVVQQPEELPQAQPDTSASSMEQEPENAGTASVEGPAGSETQDPAEEGSIPETDMLSE